MEKFRVYQSQLLHRGQKLAYVILRLCCQWWTVQIVVGRVFSLVISWLRPFPSTAPRPVKVAIMAAVREVLGGLGLQALS